jgi:hypothetical protein
LRLDFLQPVYPKLRRRRVAFGVLYPDSDAAYFLDAPETFGERRIFVCVKRRYKEQIVRDGA